MCSLLLSLVTPNDVQSVASHSKNIQATSKGSDQTARMHRLVWAFAGRIYHIVGNLMPRLKYFQPQIILWREGNNEPVLTSEDKESCLMARYSVHLNVKTFYLFWHHNEARLVPIFRCQKQFILMKQVHLMGTISAYHLYYSHSLVMLTLTPCLLVPSADNLCK